LGRRLRVKRLTKWQTRWIWAAMSEDWHVRLLAVSECLAREADRMRGRRLRYVRALVHNPVYNGSNK
jgi:hypothetical protein